ncbi:MAG: response regulator [Oscillospiraceae bacterium]|nr:response regulator [Oscillospiraceae bacterium]
METKLYDGVRYYHRVPGLSLPRHVRHDRTNADINRFIDIIPELTETLEVNSIDLEDNPDVFMKSMKLMMALLGAVRARGLELYAGRILRCVEGTQNLALARKLLKPFITDVLSLSIAMQKAQKQDAGANISEIEVHADMKRNVLTVCNLFCGGEYEKAWAVIAGLAERDPEETAYLKLLSLIAARKYAEAETAVEALYKKHIETMNRLVGTDLTKIILAVDDMPEMLSFVNNTLKNHYKVIAVPGGEAALTVLRTQKPDLFILDIDMPDMNGYELAQIIRGSDNHAKTPLVFLTGNSTREHITKAMAVGCDDFIVKPTSHERLLTVAGKFLR